MDFKNYVVLRAWTKTAEEIPHDFQALGEISVFIQNLKEKLEW